MSQTPEFNPNQDIQQQADTVAEFRFCEPTRTDEKWAYYILGPRRFCGTNSVNQMLQECSRPGFKIELPSPEAEINFTPAELFRAKKSGEMLIYYPSRLLVNGKPNALNLQLMSFMLFDNQAHRQSLMFTDEQSQQLTDLQNPPHWFSRLNRHQTSIGTEEWTLIQPSIIHIPDWKDQEGQIAEWEERLAFGNNVQLRRDCISRALWRFMIHYSAFSTPLYQGSINLTDTIISIGSKTYNLELCGPGTVRDSGLITIRPVDRNTETSSYVKRGFGLNKVKA